MRMLRKRKIAKALNVKVTFCKCPDGATIIFFIGNSGGELLTVEKNEVLSTEQFLKTLKKLS